MVDALLFSVPRREGRHVVEIGRSKKHVIIDSRVVGLSQVLRQLVVSDRMRVSPSRILKVLSSELPHSFPPPSLLGNNCCTEGATCGRQDDEKCNADHAVTSLALFWPWS